MSTVLDQIKIALDEIKNRIDKDGIPCLNQSEPEGGYFSTPLILFSTIDCLAFTWKNPSRSKMYNANTKNAVDFMRKYLGKVNLAYKSLSGIVYEIFRHPLTHWNQPSTLKLSNGRKIKWTISKGGDMPHLVNWQGTLFFNLPQLMADIKLAVGFFYKDIEKSKAAQKRFLEACKKINRPRTQKDILYRREYVTQLDFDYLNKIFN